MNLKVIIFCIAAVVFLAVPVLAENSTAKISGGVYSWDTFELLENTVVEVNSTPSQSMVAKYGLYTFELEPGDYLITASYYQNSTLIYSSEESIEVKGEGNYNVDLLLVPIYSEEFMVSENTGDMEASTNSTQSVSNNADPFNNLDANDSDANISVTETDKINGLFTSPTVYYFFAVSVLLLLIAGYNLRKRRATEKNKPESIRTEKNQSGINKMKNSRLREDKEEYEPEGFSTSASMSNFLKNGPFLEKEFDRAKSRTGQGLLLKPVETRLPEESEPKTEEEKQAENKEGQFILKVQKATPKQETEEGVEIFAEEISSDKPDLEEISLKESEKETEPSKTPEPETPVAKKNLPLPADLKEIMDIIRGQGGRITQKDLRSKLKYSEGKVSLMLADLERRELIDKFKRGRGNVIIIRDEKR